jgi:hypothetical protein
MPRLSIQQTNFTAGEISPRLIGRTDIDRYANAAALLQNVYPVIHGGAKRRDGTRFQQAAKFNASKSRLIPFIFSRDDAYMLEFGHLYVRVFKNNTYLGSELVTQYTEAMLPDIDYAQGADTMFLFHPSVPIQRLRRFAGEVFDLSAAPFTTTPFDEQGHVLNTTLTLSATTVGTGRTLTAAAGVFLASDVGRNFVCGAGLANVTGYTSATVLTVSVVIPFASASIASGASNLDVSPQIDVTPGAKDPVGTSTTLTASAAAWRTEDVGKFVRINGGLLKTTGFTSATVMQATILKAPTSVVAAPALSWSLEASVWNTANGYPRTGTLHEQRLVAAGSPKYPQTIWGSRTGEYLDFTIGTNDDEGYSFTIAADEINPISYLSSLRNLVVHTYGGEFSLQGGTEKPITPTNVRIRPESVHGSKGVRPLLIGRESVFVQRAGRKVRAMAYRYDVDGYVAPDLSVLAEHITDGGVTCMAYQQEPDLLIWLVRTDGALLSCTFDRDQSVIGWARHYTDGIVESVATIPAGDRDQTWLIVRRIVGGAVVRYIERIDDTFAPALPGLVDYNALPPQPTPEVYGCTVDCAIQVDNASSQTVFTGLAHLEGKSVQAVADGSAMGSFTVTGGQITLPRKSYRTLIGLPFVSKISCLNPEVGTGTGTAQGNSMRTGEVTVRFLNTVGAKVVDGEGNEQVLPSRRFGVGVLDQPPEVRTDNERVSMLGWARGTSSVSIVQDQPLPMHVLAVIRKFSVND